MTNTSEAISHQVAVAIAVKAEGKSGRELEAALGQNQSGSECQNVFNTLQKASSFWPFGSLNRF